MVVGSWNAEEHIDWAKKNVARSYQLKDDGVQKVKYAITSLPNLDSNETLLLLFISLYFPL